MCTIKLRECEHGGSYKVVARWYMAPARIAVYSPFFVSRDVMTKALLYMYGGSAQWYQISRAKYLTFSLQ